MILTSECWFQCHFPQRWIAQSNQLVDFVYGFLFGVRKAWYSCSNHPHQSHLLLGQLNNSVNMQYWNMVAWPHFNRPSSTGRFLISAAMIPHDIRCVMIVEKQDWKMLQGSHCCVIRNIENVAHDTCLYTKGVLIWHEKQWQKWGSTLQMAINFAAHVMGSTWCNCWSSRRIVWPIATNSSTTTMKSIVVCICFLFHGKVHHFAVCIPKLKKRSLSSFYWEILYTQLL